MKHWSLTVWKGMYVLVWGQIDDLWWLDFLLFSFNNFYNLPQTLLRTAPLATRDWAQTLANSRSPCQLNASPAMRGTHLDWDFNPNAWLHMESLWKLESIPLKVKGGYNGWLAQSFLHFPMSLNSPISSSRYTFLTPFPWSIEFWVIVLHRHMSKAHEMGEQATCCRLLVSFFPSSYSVKAV